MNSLPLHRVLPPAASIPAPYTADGTLGAGPGGPLPAPSPWLNYGTFLSYPYGVVIGAVSNMGNGALNVQSFYVNGVQFQPGNTTLDAGTY